MGEQRKAQSLISIFPLPFPTCPGDQMTRLLKPRHSKDRVIWGSPDPVTPHLPGMAPGGWERAVQRPPAPVLSSASEGKAGALLLASKARFGVPARRNTTASRPIAIISARIALGTWSRHLLPPECSPERKPAAVALLLRGLKYRVQPLLLLAERAGTLASSPTRC